MVRTVELDKNKHFSKMMNSVKQMKHEEDLCDFMIKVDKIEMQAHKLILSAGSPYFKAMLKHDTIESREGMVSMKGVDFECVKICINFMYSGKFDIPDTKTKQLLHIAIMMQLDDMKDAICNILQEELKPENFYETKCIAELYNLEDVSSKCKYYYQENLMAISAQSEFQNETKADILNLLKSKKFNLNEEEKMTLSLRWVVEKIQQKDVILELFNRIKIDEVSSEYLSDLLENHPLVSNDLRLYKMLNGFLVQSLQNTSKTAAQKESISKNQIVLFDGTSDCLRFFNPVTNEVTKTQVNELNHLESYSVVSVDSYIYILCEKSVYRLNFKSRRSRWERMCDMIVNRGAYPPCVAHSGSIFVIGCFSSPARKDVEVFNPFANSWTKLKDKPRAVRLPILVSLDESIYCIGGKAGTEPVKTFCRFTLSSEWTDLEPMRDGKYGCGAAAVDQRIFVMGGRTSDGLSIHYTNDVECYDVTMGQWTDLSPTTENPGFCVAHYFNGWIFLIGESSDKIEKYDIINNAWLKVQLESYEIFNIANSVGPQVWNGGSG